MGIRIVSYIEAGVVGCAFVAFLLFCYKKRRVLSEKEDLTGTITSGMFWTKMMLLFSILSFGCSLWCFIGINGVKDIERYKEDLVLAQFLFLVLGSTAGSTIGGINWRIVVYEDHCVYTNWLGVKRTYYYDGIKMRRLWVRGSAAYYFRGRRVASVAALCLNREALTLAINAYKAKETYSLPTKQWYIDLGALRREEREWAETASEKDRALYDDLVSKLRKGEDPFYLWTYVSETDVGEITPYLEETLLSWEDRKMQAILAYIVGNKENKGAYGVIRRAYLSLPWQEKKRYASLYDKALRSTVTREALLADTEWLADWHAAYNLPDTMKKIAKGNLPGIKDIWISILKQKNRYDREYYDFEEAKATLSSLVKR